MSIWFQIPYFLIKIQRIYLKSKDHKPPHRYEHASLACPRADWWICSESNGPHYRDMRDQGPGIKFMVRGQYSPQRGQNEMRAILYTILTMASSNGNIFRVTVSGDLCIPLTKASDADFWCLLWFAPGQRLSKRHTIIYDKSMGYCWKDVTPLLALNHRSGQT